MERGTNKGAAIGGIVVGSLGAATGLGLSMMCDCHGQYEALLRAQLTQPA